MPLTGYFAPGSANIQGLGQDTSLIETIYKLETIIHLNRKEALCMAKLSHLKNELLTRLVI